MEAAMAQLEREMAGIDDENPDPRQLGHCMRRMSEITGEKLPVEMEEMVRRLELGEDPEKLEEEYGDAFAEDGAFEADNEGGETGGARLRRWLGGRSPIRDPKLYEMDDYLPK